MRCVYLTARQKSQGNDQLVTLALLELVEVEDVNVNLVLEVFMEVNVGYVVVALELIDVVEDVEVFREVLGDVGVVELVVRDVA
eukprot:2560494-Amphidinium_carterae.1